MNLPETLLVGVPLTTGEAVPTPHVEVGADWADLPAARDVLRDVDDGQSVSMIASPIITHRRTDPRYKRMKHAPPEHAAVGHFERSRWTDEAWEDCNDLAKEIDAHAVVLQTPASFKATAEHALRLENFVAHAMRPDLVIAWEWGKGSWPEKKAIELCERIGAVPVIDPTEREIPATEFVYLRVRGGASGRAALKDDDLKKVALALRDRVGWLVFSNRTGVADAERFLQML